MTTHRRQFLRLCGVAGIGAIAGCSERFRNDDRSSNDDSDSDSDDGPSQQVPWIDNWLYEREEIAKVTVTNFSNVGSAYEDLPQVDQRLIDDLRSFSLFEFTDINPLSVNVGSLTKRNFSLPDLDDEARIKVLTGDFSRDTVVDYMGGLEVWEDVEDYENYRIFEPPSVNAHDIAVGDKAIIAVNAEGIDDDATVKPYLDTVDAGEISGGNGNISSLWEGVPNNPTQLNIFVESSPTESGLVSGGDFVQPSEDKHNYVLVYAEASDAEELSASNFAYNESEVTETSVRTNGRVVTYSIQEPIDRYLVHSVRM